MSDEKKKPEAEPAESALRPEGGTQPEGERPEEFPKRKGLDPTRFGDWEKGGRCIDF